MTDIEIAQQAQMRPITEIARAAGIDEENLLPLRTLYGEGEPRALYGTA